MLFQKAADVFSAHSQCGNTILLMSDDAAFQCALPFLPTA